MFLFLVLINDAGFTHEDRSLGDKLTKAANARKAIQNLHLKYVDDLTIAESIRLNDVLSVENNKVWERPLKYHERTMMVLNPVEDIVQQELVRFYEFTVKTSSN